MWANKSQSLLHKTYMLVKTYIRVKTKINKTWREALWIEIMENQALGQVGLWFFFPHSVRTGHLHSPQGRFGADRRSASVSKKSSGSGHRLGSTLGEACLVDINFHGCPEAATYASGAPWGFPQCTSLPSSRPHSHSCSACWDIPRLPCASLINTVFMG